MKETLHIAHCHLMKLNTSGYNVLKYYVEE